MRVSNYVYSITLNGILNALHFRASISNSQFSTYPGTNIYCYAMDNITTMDVVKSSLEYLSGSINAALTIIIGLYIYPLPAKYTAPLDYIYYIIEYTSNSLTVKLILKFLGSFLH